MKKLPSLLLFSLLLAAALALPAFAQGTCCRRPLPQMWGGGAPTAGDGLHPLGRDRNVTLRRKSTLPGQPYRAQRVLYMAL